MANFYMTLSTEEISRQIAELLNNNNKLTRYHSIHTLKLDKGAYFVDIVGGQVIGCSAIHQENDQLTRQFHLCVHPNFRRLGIGRKLKLAALAHIVTPYVYITIREDNIASINLNMSLGFVLVKKDWAGDHNVLTLGGITANVRSQTIRMDDKHSGNKPPALFYTGV